MKNILRFALAITIGISFQSKSQVLEWSNIFATHSQGAGAGITPNSLIDNTGKIITVVVENDVLKLYQTLSDGAITNVFSLDKAIHDNYTPLIKVGQNEQALAFKAGPFPGAFWLLQTDAELNVTREVSLILPNGMTSASIYNLIEYDEELYLTMTTNGNHYLLKINDDNTLSVVYNSSIEIAFGEDYILLDNGNIVFSYKRGNNHIIRCISFENEALVWEESIETGHGILMDYNMVKNGNIIYTFGDERKWVDGIAVDKITISHIDIFSGEVLFQEPLILPTCNNCDGGFDDFIYNETNNRLYFSYKIYLPEPAVVLLEIDPQSIEILKEAYFPFQFETDFFPFNKRSFTHIKPDGSLVLVYRSYKNTTEQMNLYVTPLNSELQGLGTFEFNVEELESTEHPTDVLSYDNSRLLITGIVPNKNPSISWEQIEYFTLLVNTDELLSVDAVVNDNVEITAYPNPTSDKITFTLPENDSFEISVYNITGQLIFQDNDVNGNYILDLNYCNSGVYIVYLKGKEKKYMKRIIKN